MPPLDWKDAPRPIIALSPMADMTDSAFCRVVRSVTVDGVLSPRTPSVLGPVDAARRRGPRSAPPRSKQSGPDSMPSGVIVFREMVSAEAVVRGNDKTLGMTAIHPDERPLVQQVFGSDPATMAEAARIIAEEHHPEGFDINMGCPVYKIVHQFNGAALMKEPRLAADIVRAMKAAITVPLSVKIRLGWENPNDCIEFAKVLEDAGTDLLTVHGRTKCQGYSGVADWQQVGRVKAAVRIPVLCNGDIHTADKVPVALAASGCDGVLLARGALGNPWIFRQVDEVLHEQPQIPVTFAERMRVVRLHLAWHLDQYGAHAVPLFRKHLSWYFKGIPHMKAYKDSLMRAQTPEEIEAVFAACEATDHAAH